jgi:hypothetical protein
MRGLLQRAGQFIRQAAADGPFAVLVYLMFVGGPLVGFAYIVLRAVLGLFGVNLPEPRTSVR